MKEVSLLIKGTLGGMVSALGYIFGGWDLAIQFLVYAFVVDLLTGIAAAMFDGDVNSWSLIKGVIKKMVIFLMVGLGNMAGLMLQQDSLRFVVIMAYAGYEVFSIAENVIKLDLPFPEQLKKYFRVVTDDEQ